MSLPPDVGRLLDDVPELQRPRRGSEHTVLGLLDAPAARPPVCDAEQSITVGSGAAPRPATRSALAAGHGGAAIDRVYSDGSGRPVELAVSWFHPDHYSYRVRLRRSGS